MASERRREKTNSDGSRLGFEATLGPTADNLRGNLDADFVDCMVAVLGQLFYSTQISVSLPNQAVSL